ncbi:MAG: hypothetical protein LBC88_07710 [Spirochaetaceae bacterium]|jgi:hypothetical protein|nr:hypothetical protein [Spirochaetaceae bacterium]
MAKDGKAVYAPGELGKVRGRLGNIDPHEAKRLVQVLGGEVGVERSPDPPPAARPASRRGGGGRSVPRKRVEPPPDEGAPRPRESAKNALGNLSDNPAQPVQLSYRERVKIDQYMGQSEFDIKSGFQVLKSILSFTGEPPDYVKPRFITRHLAEYHKHIEALVANTRNLCPRNNLRRSEKLKRTSPFSARIIDTIRFWNIERFTSELNRVQSHPRDITTSDLIDILKVVYKPLVILEKLDNEAHIKEAYKLVYKIIFIEDPSEAKGKYQDMIRNALSALVIIRKDVQYLLYPLLLKLLSDQWLPYESFFQERRNRLFAFLGITGGEELLPSMNDLSGAAPHLLHDDADAAKEEPEGKTEEDSDTVSGEENDRNMVRENERKAVERGLKTLESLFPEAGWDRLDEGVDLYPYFQEVFKFKRDYVLLNPRDSLIQVAVLMHILEGLCIGLRQVRFGMVRTPDGEQEDAAEMLGPVINNWQYFMENSFEKEYLPRLSEYCRILENSAESRTSNYARRTYDEIHWTKRLYFLPFYRFEASFPQPFQKGDVAPVYPEVRTLRRYLTAAAAGIERGIKKGGAEKRAVCDGIANPWDTYLFEVPNPVSTRLDALLGAKQKNNASLVFFSLAAAIVLDYILNNETSWAAAEPGVIPFRSIDNAGITPQRGVDKKIDADAIFRDMVKRIKAKNSGQGN